MVSNTLKSVHTWAKMYLDCFRKMQRFLKFLLIHTDTWCLLLCQLILCFDSVDYNLGPRPWWRVKINSWWLSISNRVNTISRVLSCENMGWIWWSIWCLKLNKTSFSVFLREWHGRPKQEAIFCPLSKTDPYGLPFSHRRSIHTMTCFLSTYEAKSHNDFLLVHIWGQFTQLLPPCPYMRSIHTVTSSP